MLSNDLKNSQYFNSLPFVIQESIIQSGLDFDSEDSIRQFVTQIDGVDEDVE